MSAIGDKLRALEYAPNFDAENAVDPADMLRQLTELTQVALPEDYKTFLAEFPSTGLFDVGIFSTGLTKALGVPTGQYPVEVLYAASSKKREDLLSLRKRQATESEIPLYLLRIGADPGGDYYCMDLRPEGFGKVHYLSSEVPVEEGLFLVANDFGSFIENLWRNEQ